MMEPGQVLKLLEILLQPAEKDQVVSGPEGQGDSGVFEQQLATNVQRAQSWLGCQGNESLRERLSKLKSPWDQHCCEARWSHVLMTLKVMVTLEDVMGDAMATFQLRQAQSEDRQKTLNPDASAPAMSPDTLSFSQQKTLRTALQFVVCLGIAPNLHAGVGLPLALRSGFAAALQAANPSQLNLQEKQVRLTFCVWMLLKTCQQPVLSSLILTQHLGDLMAALTQLAYAPKPKQASQLQPGQASQTAGGSPERTHPKEVLSSSDKHTYTEAKQEQQSGHKDTVGAQTSSPSPAELKQTHDIQEPGKQANIYHTDPTCDLHEPANEITSETEKSGYRTNGCSHPKQLAPSTTCSAGVEVDSVITLEALQCYNAAERLEWLLGRVYTPLVVRQLLLLQGGPSGPPPAATRAKGMPPVRLPRAPVWLRHVCGKLLSSLLMKPGGVQNILKGMLDNSQGGPNKAAEWRRCDAVAAVIANCPQQVSLDDYFQAVGPQICELLIVEDKLLARKFVRVAVTTMGSMLTKHPRLAECSLWRPLMAALYDCQEGVDISLSDSPRMVVLEERLSNVVESVHRLTTACEPQSSVWPWLLTVAQPMFVIYCCSQDAISNLRTKCSTILEAFLKYGSDNQALALLQQLALDEPDSQHLITDKTLMNFHENLELRCGSGGGLEVCSRIPNSGPASWQCYEVRSRCTVTLIQSAARPGLVAQFFVKLLQELTSVLTTTEVEDVVLPGGIGGGTSEQQRSVCHRGLLLLHVIGELCETLDYQAFTDTTVILNFVQVTLEHSIAILQRCKEELSAAFENETVSLAMGLLTALLGGAMKLKSSDRYAMERILPLLDKFAKEHPDEFIKEMATDLSITIATHGAVKFNGKAERPNLGKKDADKNKVKQDDKHQAQKPLVEVISETIHNDLPKKSPGDLDKNVAKKEDDYRNIEDTAKPGKEEKLTNESVRHETTSMGSIANSVRNQCNLKDQVPDGSGKEGGRNSAYQKALAELKDPLLPVRGHGLIALRKLIENKDPETLRHNDFLLDAFRKNLQDEDSYLYLGAINALSALGEQCPLLVLPVLASEYSETAGHPSQMLLKLGEVLVKTSRLLGDTLPAYRDLLLASCLKATCSADALVRASAMSNLGELCKMLRFSLGNVLHEVVNCVESLLKTDPDVSVRRAAALFSYLLFQGLGADAGQILGSSLREVYRLLKHVLVTEKDTTVCQHVQLALDELDAIMRRYIFPPQTLTKTIHVLDVP